MPTYEYKCEKCGPFELFQSIKDDALKSCPKCGSKVERLISANVGFVFKGSGFYQTDYKSKNSVPPAPVTAAMPPTSSSKEAPQASSEVAPSPSSTGSTSAPPAGSGQGTSAHTSPSGN
jgi:putative FmdB family regulatory protein